MLNTIIVLLFGFSVSIFLGHIFTAGTIEILRREVKAPAPPGSFTRLLGCLERLIYTISVILGMYFLIGVWLAVKTAGRWAPSKSEREKLRESVGRINIFLIGNLISLFFGIIGGVIIRILLGMPNDKWP